MKLNEIFQTQVQNVDSDRNFPRSAPNVGGVFSFTTPDEDPHMIRKSHKKTVGKAAEQDYMMDAFPYYARIVYENQLWDEVHFPRIYEVKKVGQGDSARWTWRMERLRELQKLEEHQYEVLADIYFGGVRTSKKHSYPWIFSTHIKDAFYRKGHRIEDDQFLSCIEMLRGMRDPIRKMAVEDHPLYDRVLGLVVDLHPGNVMVRLSGTSPQLVLLDPFAFSL